jgi:4-hydroxythreonine-4-phosphate dehydrogenase
MKNKPIIAITMGDVNGVGPEIIAKLFAERNVYKLCRPIVIGDKLPLLRSIKITDRKLKIKEIQNPRQADFVSGVLNLIDLNLIRRHKWGQISKEAGRAAKFQALVTAPLNKEAMQKGGYKYQGHTELLAELTGCSDFRMMLVTGSYKVIHVSVHVSLRQACSLVTKERVYKTILLLKKTLDRFSISSPKVAVAGLNPHAGEGGIFGREEIQEIIPAIKKAARIKNMTISGPVPPDTLFVNKKFDGIVAMYHDQGHIAVKSAAFDKAVNLTAGLPIIRTSVAHGTAFDIAGKGLARTDSLWEAVKCAVKLIYKN